ncbi:hypothetical protein [Streptomyces fractus]|uniref:hypothetical protein n=1 Tax=Streptomyces fractus TaxID=641806 RepID=UPI003CEE4DB6
MSGLFSANSASATSAGGGLLKANASTVMQQAQVVVQAPVGTTLESIPVPRPPAGDGELSVEEQHALEACEAGMANLQTAFWVAGKSLESMKTGRLFRNSGYGNFAEFVWKKWEISETQMHRLMDEWRIGELLHSRGWSPRESQIRELTSIKNQSGSEAAANVYDAIARVQQARKKRVTAKVVAGVVKQLPPIPDKADAGTIKQLVRETMAPPARNSDDPSAGAHSQVMAGGTEQVHAITSLQSHRNTGSPIGEPAEQSSSPAESADPGIDLSDLAVILTDLQAATRRLRKPAVRRARSLDPERTQRLIDGIRSTLNEIEHCVTTWTGSSMH